MVCQALDRLSAADIPATPLHTLEPFFDDPYLIRQGRGSGAGAGPGSLVLVTESGCRPG